MTGVSFFINISFNLYNQVSSLTVVKHTKKQNKTKNPEYRLCGFNCQSTLCDFDKLLDSSVS